MISAIGNKRRAQSRRAGFSLIEIALVLGLIVIVTAVMVTNFVALADRGGELSDEDQLHQAIGDARYAAASERTITTLRFDKESGSLIVEAEGAEISRYKLSEEFGQLGRHRVNFYLIPPSRGLAPPKTSDDARTPAPLVRFAPDRSSSPFVVEIDGESSTPERFVFDPFSSLLVTPQ